MFIRKKWYVLLVNSITAQKNSSRMHRNTHFATHLKIKIISGKGHCQIHPQWEWGHPHILPPYHSIGDRQIWNFQPRAHESLNTPLLQPREWWWSSVDNALTTLVAGGASSCQRQVSVQWWLHVVADSPDYRPTINTQQSRTPSNASLHALLNHAVVSSDTLSASNNTPRVIFRCFCVCSRASIFSSACVADWHDFLLYAKTLKITRHGRIASSLNKRRKSSVRK